MARVCEICSKKTQVGSKISRSEKHSKRKFKPNLQKVRVKTDSGVKRMWVCTRCIKAGKIDKAG